MKRFAGIVTALCLLSCAAGCQYYFPCPDGYDEDSCAIWTTVQGLICENPDYQALDSNDACTPLAREWILLAFELLKFMDESLNRAFTRLTTFSSERDVVLDGGEFLSVLSQPNVVISREFCRPMCEMSRMECGCGAPIDAAATALVGGDREIASQLVDTFSQKCSATRPENAFETTLIGFPSCVNVADYKPIRATWVC